MLEHPKDIQTTTQPERAIVTVSKLDELDNQQPSACAKAGEGSETRDAYGLDGYGCAHSAQPRKCG